VVWDSSTDPLGTNTDENFEIFAYQVSTETVYQLTDTATGSCYSPRISEDGAYVYFYSDAPIFGDALDTRFDPYRVHRATARVERVGGLATLGGPSFDSPMAPDGTGSRVAFTSEGNFVDGNPDWGKELWLIDGSVPQCIGLSGPAPTEVTATPDAGPLRFDFLRGDPANLGYAGDEVDLGPVVCLEDDSPDHHTQGFEDGVDPDPGEAFFYLYRGALGPDEAGSWGQATGGEERQAGAGACNP
jgi:hypothetical protein